MASNYVSDSKHAKSVSAWIILGNRGEYIAKVQAVWSDSGRCLVNVFQAGKAAERSAVASQKMFAATQGAARKTTLSKPPNTEAYRFQCGSANGYGYDKFTAALSDMWIDGVRMLDHCGLDPAATRILKRYHKAAPKTALDHISWHAAAKKIGASFANWCYTKNRYDNLYIRPGLNRLEALGYKVYQAI